MIVAAPLANLVIRRLGGNADRQEVGRRLNKQPCHGGPIGLVGRRPLTMPDISLDTKLDSYHKMIYVLSAKNGVARASVPDRPRSRLAYA